ncbi:MAG TPA: type II toxin-antitoxin system VapC family toxin [Gaiellaceae bacterium]|nr:type II toxin-antitoxin system VapC family toxin [Gaiellaceae bacterium]
MRLLLDTQVMLWAVGDPGRIRPTTRATIDDPNNDVLVSSASVWESSIKIASGKLRLPMDLGDAVDRSGFRALQITHNHAIAAGALPRHHRDPFDRMLVAQAQLEGLTLVTTDRQLAAYDVAVLPA